MQIGRPSEGRARMIIALDAQAFARQPPQAFDEIVDELIERQFLARHEMQLWSGRLRVRFVQIAEVFLIAWNHAAVVRDLRGKRGGRLLEKIVKAIDGQVRLRRKAERWSWHRHRRQRLRWGGRMRPKSLARPAKDAHTCLGVLQRGQRLAHSADCDELDT